MGDEKQLKADEIQQMDGGFVDFAVNGRGYKILPARLNQLKTVGEMYSKILVGREKSDIVAIANFFPGKEEAAEAVWGLLKMALGESADIESTFMEDIMPVIEFYLFRKRPQEG